MTSQEFSCFQLSEIVDGHPRHTIKTLTTDSLPPGDVLIRVHWSSLNYKDALAANGHPGVAGAVPHVPGIDAAGVVEASDDPRYAPGSSVLVTGYELGAPKWGGWSEFIRVPADWVVPLPSALSLRESMVLGTAGFTAAQCVRELRVNDVLPESGPVLVTGATGGVGCWAIRILSHLGYEVHAVSGKSELRDRLIELGATEVHGREVLEDNPKRPMLKAAWAGGVDTVGGSMLDAFLKATNIGGCVAACGLVAGDKLNLTVYPFILRGVKLAGVTSSSCPRGPREAIWKHLSSDWHVRLPEDWISQVAMDELESAIQRISAGQCVGRYVVKIGAE